MIDMTNELKGTLPSRGPNARQSVNHPQRKVFADSAGFVVGFEDFVKRVHISVLNNEEQIQYSRVCVCLKLQGEWFWR